MDRTDIFQNVKNAAYQIIQGKGATNYAIGLATTRILESLLKNENRVLPISSLLTNYHDITDVCLSVPCIVNQKGVDSILPIPLNDAEKSGLQNSAEQIRNAIQACGF
jgi:L-lactate dehydrogenase